MPRMQAFTPEQAARHGMGLALAAREHPERLAIVSRYRDRTFGELLPEEKDRFSHRGQALWRLAAWFSEGDAGARQAR